MQKNYYKRLKGQGRNALRMELNSISRASFPTDDTSEDVYNACVTRYKLNLKYRKRAAFRRAMRARTGVSQLKQAQKKKSILFGLIEL